MLNNQVFVIQTFLSSLVRRKCHAVTSSCLFQKVKQAPDLHRSQVHTALCSRRSQRKTIALQRVGLSKVCTRYSTNSSIDQQSDSVPKDEKLKELLKEIHHDFAQNKEETPSPPSDPECMKDDKATDGRREFDIDEELLRYDYEEFEEKEHYDSEPEDVVEEEQYSISLERGSTGVFDIEEVVQVLQEDNAIDICVVEVPPETKYVDHIVIVTGRSTRHLNAMAQYLRKLFKLKRRKGDRRTTLIEGKQTDWLALDLGNIAVHLFSAEVRTTYDLESLWTVGPEYDAQCRTQTEDELLTTYWGDSTLVDIPGTDGFAQQSGRQTFESVSDWHKKS